MANDYATPSMIETQTNIDIIKYNDLVEFMLDTAAEHIDSYCGRPEGFKALTTATAKTFVGRGKNFIRIPENIQITAVGVKDTYYSDTYTNWLTTDWIAYRGSEKFPIFETPYTKLATSANGNYSIFTDGFIKGRTPINTVSVTAKWGYASVVPKQITEATIIQAVRWIKRAQAVYGDSVGSVEFGNISFVNDMDKDMKQILKMGRWVKPAI